MWRRGKLAFALASTQFLVLILFTLRAYYGKDADATDYSQSLDSSGGFTGDHASCRGT